MLRGCAYRISSPTSTFTSITPDATPPTSDAPLLYLDLAPNPQNRILGLYKPSPPTRTTELLGFEPAQAGFVCVAAISNRQVEDVNYGIEPLLKESHLKVVGDWDPCSLSLAIDPWAKGFYEEGKHKSPLPSAFLAEQTTFACRCSGETKAIDS